MKCRVKYRFSHRAGDYYYWYSTLPVAGSLYEQIICPVRWFWESGKPGEYWSILNSSR
jgi:hypothetical protein